MKTLIIIPTYNEIENIEQLLEQVLAKSETIEVLVIDEKDY